MNTTTDTSRISPTAHYTGQVWQQHGLAPPALGTTTGRAMHLLMRAPMRLASYAMGGLSLDDVLLQRHLMIDALVERAIADGARQVIEIAGGLSARGHRLAGRFASLTYVEGDLPNMANRKRRALATLPWSDNHHVVDVNALDDSIFERVVPLLDDAAPTVLVTEGLIQYFPRHQVDAMWQRWARLLARYPRGTYLSDIHYNDAKIRGRVARSIRRTIKLVARGDTHIHFACAEDLLAGARDAGFMCAAAHNPSDMAAELSLPTGPNWVTILEATV